MSKRNFPIDSIAELIFDKRIETMEVKGFIASNKDDHIVLFPLRTGAIGYRLHEDDILGIVEPKNDGEPCTLTVRADASVQIVQIKEKSLKAHELPKENPKCNCHSDTVSYRAGIVPVSPGQANCRGRCFDDFLWCPHSADRCLASYNACNSACEIFGLHPSRFNSGLLHR